MSIYNAEQFCILVLLIEWIILSLHSFPSPIQSSKPRPTTFYLSVYMYFSKLNNVEIVYYYVIYRRDSWGCRKTTVWEIPPSRPFHFDCGNKLEYLYVLFLLSSWNLINKQHQAVVETAEASRFVEHIEEVRGCWFGENFSAGATERANYLLATDLWTIG